MPPDGCALVIVDERMRPVFVSANAVRVLLELQLTGAAEWPEAVGRRVCEILRQPAHRSRCTESHEVTCAAGEYRWVATRLERIGATPEGTPLTALMLLPANVALSAIDELAHSYRLTARETDMLRCIVEGISTRDAARNMQISASTARAFVRRLKVKMGVTSRAEILAEAFRSAAGEPLLPCIQPERSAAVTKIEGAANGPH